MEHNRLDNSSHIQYTQIFKICGLDTSCYLLSKCNSMHPLYGAIPVPYLPALVTLVSLVAHRYDYAPLPCRTLQYRITLFYPLSMVWNWQVLTALQCLFIGLSCSPPFYFLFSLYYFSFYLLVLWDWGIRTDGV